MKIVTHVGNTVEAYQVVGAVIDNGDDDITLAGRKTAEQLMNLGIAFQISDGVFRLSQIWTFLGELGIGLVVEIAVYLVGCRIVVGQLVIKFFVVARTADKHYMMQVSFFHAVPINKSAENKPVYGTDNKEGQ